jgi:hypothetical protein
MSCEILEDTSTETLLYTVSVTDPTNDTVTCSITTPLSIFFMQIGTDQFSKFTRTLCKHLQVQVATQRNLCPFCMNWKSKMATRTGLD